MIEKSPTLLTSAWFGCHSNTIALTSSHFFKRSLMADVGIGPLSSSSCSEGDTFRCASWCSSFKISWSSIGCIPDHLRICVRCPNTKKNLS
ncbi:UNVERIFIED_CONTAM: hypothetical protein NCL1_19584 [Trichonephila clavipes]